jgi:Putative Actinobacterial Holin-X, holin superfamily III
MATREQQPSESQQELREHSTGDLVKQLSQQVSTLVRQEVELAKAEMGEKGKKAGVGFGTDSGHIRPHQ